MRFRNCVQRGGTCAAQCRRSPPQRPNAMVNHVLSHATGGGSEVLRRPNMKVSRAIMAAIQNAGDAPVRVAISDSWPAQADGHAFAFCGAIYLSLGRRQRSATLRLKNEVGGRDVDLALKLNVLAVLAVFAFVGAILLGAL